MAFLDEHKLFAVSSNILYYINSAWTSQLLTPLEPQSRFGDKALKFQVICPQLSPKRDCSSKRVKLSSHLPRTARWWCEVQRWQVVYGIQGAYTVLNQPASQQIVLLSYLCNSVKGPARLPSLSKITDLTRTHRNLSARSTCSSSVCWTRKYLYGTLNGKSDKKKRTVQGAVVVVIIITVDYSFRIVFFFCWPDCSRTPSPQRTDRSRGSGRGWGPDFPG